MSEETIVFPSELPVPQSSDDMRVENSVTMAQVKPLRYPRVTSMVEGTRDVPIKTLFPDETAVLSRVEEVIERLEGPSDESSMPLWRLEEHFFEAMDGLDYWEAEYFRAIDDPALLFTHLNGYTLDYCETPTEKEAVDPYYEVLRLEWGVEFWNWRRKHDALTDLNDQLNVIFGQGREPGEFALTEIGIDRDHVKRLLEELYDQNHGYRALRDASKRLGRAWKKAKQSRASEREVAAVGANSAEATEIQAGTVRE